MKFFTIGIYGTTRDSFFGALKKYKITHFCDIRLRRGLRGSTYKYGNAKELEATLEEMGIAYRHVTDLAPTEAIRAKQFAVDKKKGISSGRERQELSTEFSAAYQKQVLSKFGIDSFIKEFPSRANVVLFCVESEPHACHRSLVAVTLAKHTESTVTDITP